MLITGKENIELFRLVTIKSAMGLYLRSGMRVNASYTPTNMNLVVSKITGKSYGSSKKGVQLAFNDLVAHIEQLKTSQVSHNPTEISDEAQSSTATVIEQQNR